MRLTVRSRSGTARLASAVTLALAALHPASEVPSLLRTYAGPQAAIGQ